MSTTAPTKKQLVTAILVLQQMRALKREAGERGDAQQYADVEVKLRNQLSATPDRPVRKPRFETKHAPEDIKA